MKPKSTVSQKSCLSSLTGPHDGARAGSSSTQATLSGAPGLPRARWALFDFVRTSNPSTGGMRAGAGEPRSYSRCAPGRFDIGYVVVHAECTRHVWRESHFSDGLRGIIGINCAVLVSGRRGDSQSGLSKEGQTCSSLAVHDDARAVRGVSCKSDRTTCPTDEYLPRNDRV